MRTTNMRLTDMLEQGLWLVLKQYDQDLPLLTSQVRFLVNNTTKAQQLMLRRFLYFLVWAEVRKLSPMETESARFLCSFLEGLETSDGKFFPDGFRLYQRYGRTAEERAQLTSS